METRGRPKLNLSPKKMLGVAVRPELIERIKKLAEFEQRSVSSWVERELVRVVSELEKAR